MLHAASINWEIAGAELASLSDNEQALFFKGFLAELRSWGSITKAQMQMEYIRVKLSDTDKRFAIDTFGQLVHELLLPHL